MGGVTWPAGPTVGWWQSQAQGPGASLCMGAPQRGNGSVTFSVPMSRSKGAQHHH